MEFIESPNKTVTNGRQIDLAVVHDMEAPEGPATAENVARYFQRTSVRASAHYCHDTDSTVQCVLDKDVAWHAPGANHNGIGHELAGYARQTRDEWLDDDSQAVMRQAAGQVAEDVRKYNLPVEFVDAAGLRAGNRGITTHLEVTRSGLASGSHWDPGYEFPMDVFLGMVNEALGGAAVPTTSWSVADGDLLENGDEGPLVVEWQNFLLAAGVNVDQLNAAGGADGKFGAATEEATKVWQRQIGVTDDGIVGPQTRETTARVLAWLAAVAAAQTPAPAPEPAAPVSAPQSGIAEDGILGPQTVGAMQAALGIDTDGIFGPVTKRALQERVGATVDGQFGPNSIRALQAHVGADPDGIWGANTTLAIQRALNQGLF